MAVMVMLAILLLVVLAQAAMVLEEEVVEQSTESPNPWLLTPGVRLLPLAAMAVLEPTVPKVALELGCITAAMAVAVEALELSVS